MEVRAEGFVMARALGGGVRGVAAVFLSLVTTAQPAAMWGAERTPAAVPPSILVVQPAGARGGAWREWWRASRAPARWSAALPVVANAVAWRPLAPGLEWGELRLAGAGEAWRVRVIVARMDPRRFALQLHANVQAGGMAGPWSVDAAPPDAALAFNAGQFDGSGPWGWVVHHGVEIRPPGAGPLAPAFVVDGTGAARLVSPDSIAILRRTGGVIEAFQSYPALLLDNGEVPRQLLRGGRGVDLLHRDSRAAIGVLRDGRVVVALTRFEGLGGALERLPFGPTVPEMAAIMGALGCSRAMLLDGGISGQLLLRAPKGRVREWRGMRAVPLGVVAVFRSGSRDERTRAAAGAFKPLTR